MLYLHRLITWIVPWLGAALFLVSAVLYVPVGVILMVPFSPITFGLLLFWWKDRQYNIRWAQSGRWWNEKPHQRRVVVQPVSLPDRSSYPQVLTPA